MDVPVIVAVIAAAGSIVVAAITALAAHRKSNVSRAEPPPAPNLARGPSITGNTVNASGNVTIQQILGATYEINDAPSGVVLDTISLVARRGGTGFYRNTHNNPARTLTISLTNPGSELVLVPKIELVKLAVVPAVTCSFPNDSITAAIFGVYERQVKLDSAVPLDDILEQPVQLQPRESFAVRLGLTCEAQACYQIQLRVYWKLPGSQRGQTIKSEPYMINFGQGATTWRQQVAQAVAQGSVIFVSLGRGWRDFADFARSIAGSGRLFYRNAADIADEEFILIYGQTTSIIVPELPSRDRYAENTVDRSALLITDSVFLEKYEKILDSESFYATNPLGEQ